MNNVPQTILTLNAVTGPRVSRPSVSPDTLKRFNHPYYSFLQTYCLKKGSKKWYGRLSNFGLQHPFPLTVVMPEKVTEFLGLENNDTVKIELAQISAAELVRYEILGTIDHAGSNLRPLLYGIGFETDQEYVYDGNHIRIATIEPQQSFYDKTTQLEVLHGQEEPERGQTSIVQTGHLPTDTETAEFEEIIEEQQ